MNETQLSIPETKLQRDAGGGGEGAIFKDSLAALRNEMPADIFKDAAANKIESDSLNKSGDAGNEQVERLSTRNESLEGQRHPETGVPFERKEVENELGEMVEVVVPDFDSVFDAKLPEDKLQATDSEQFEESNSQLKEWCDNNSEGAAKEFDKEALADIANGRTPEGKVWHHSENKGEMQLVDVEIHAKTGHTGGKSIWGGGSENR